MQRLTDVISQGNIETVSQKGGRDKCWEDKKKVMNYTWTLDMLQICPCVCVCVQKLWKYTIYIVPWASSLMVRLIRIWPLENIYPVFDLPAP